MSLFFGFLLYELYQNNAMYLYLRPQNYIQHASYSSCEYNTRRQRTDSFELRLSMVLSTVPTVPM